MTLKDKMKEWINGVVYAIDSAPPWQPQWFEIATTMANDFKHENPDIKISKPQMFV